MTKTTKSRKLEAYPETRKKGWGAGIILAILSVLFLLFTGAAQRAQAQTLNTLINFNGDNGSKPWAGLVADSNGNLFGTTSYGGTLPDGLTGYGTVFEIPYDSSTGQYATSPTILATFGPSASGDTLTLPNGAYPLGGLYIDSSGNLFGTTAMGGTLPDGSSGFGTVFEIPHNSSGYGTLQTLVSFDGSDGDGPMASLIADANGNLFGTTAGDPTAYLDCDNDCDNGGTYAFTVHFGTVFEIPYNSSTGDYATSPTTLADFGNSTTGFAMPNGAFPMGALYIDASGNLLGTTYEGGTLPDGSTGSPSGTVFEIPYNSSGYGALQTLVTFDWEDGQYPMAGLIADANGNLFGTTYEGGTLPEGSTAFPVGTVFEIPYNSSTGEYATSPTTLVTFDGSDGLAPWGGLIADAKGNLFGTTNLNGTLGTGQLGFGSVFEVPYNSSTGDYATSPTTLISFDGNDGQYPIAGLIADARGNLFGTTAGMTFEEYADGVTDVGNGTVFELTGSGFVAPLSFAGTPGKADCSGVTTSTLAHTYGGIAHAAKSLGFTSVGALQTAVTSYCGK